MGFAIPSLSDLVQRARASFRANLPGTDAWLWPNNVAPSAKLIAGMTHEVFGFADYTARQKFAVTADGENLDRHGSEFGLARRPAQPATGRITITASAGAISVAAGALFTRGDGAEFLAQVGGALSAAGTLDVPVTSSLDGKAGVTIQGAPMAIASGVSGAGASTALAAAAAGGLVGGSDVEDDESFRARILFRKRNPPHGGSAADYVIWASAVPGVTRVFVERLFIGPGTARVFVLMDDLYPNGIPQDGDIARVQEHLEAVKPAGAFVLAAAPEPLPVDVAIAGLTPYTTDVRAAAEAELRDAFLRLGRVAGTDTPHSAMPYLATPFTFSRSWIWQAVANAAGEERHAIAQPDADIAVARGQIPVLGSIIPI